MNNDPISQVVIFYNKITKQPGFTASHVSTYLTLFFYWRDHGYPSTFHVNQEVLFEDSRLDTLKELEDCLEYLEKNEYIETYPDPVSSSELGIKVNFLS